MRRLTKSFQNWIDDERGGIAIFGLYMFMSVLIMAGLAIDMSHLINNKTRLQIAADTAAHAALYNRDTKSADDSKVAALAVANAAMPSGRYGDVLKVTDIHFGSLILPTRVLPLTRIPARPSSSRPTSSPRVPTRSRVFFCSSSDLPSGTYRSILSS